MSALDPLIACSGRWVGTSELRVTDTSPPETSSSNATATPVLGNRFVRLDYTWVHDQTPQEGSVLLGYDESAGEATAQWADTWHMGDKVMSCRGSIEPSGRVSVRGSYAAPPGPDWGWRIDITPERQSLRVVMYNVTPEGTEGMAVDAEYARE